MGRKKREQTQTPAPPKAEAVATPVPTSAPIVPLAFLLNPLKGF